MGGGGGAPNFTVFRIVYLTNHWYCKKWNFKVQISFSVSFYRLISSAFKVCCSSTIGLMTIGAHMYVQGVPNVSLFLEARFTQKDCQRLQAKDR